MFWLAKLGVLSKWSLGLKDDMPLCTSWMFGTDSCWKCKTKGNKWGYIHNDTDNKPRYGLSVDQLQSSHPVLVPQY